MVSFAIDPPATWGLLPGAANPGSTHSHGAQTVDDQVRVAETLVLEMGGHDLRTR